MAIKTEDCKKAIVAFVKNNPGHVASKFVDEEATDVATFEKPAALTSNWKREFKEKVHVVGEYGAAPGRSHKPSINFRCFDCRPYDDQLRAYTWDDGQEILKIRVEGE